MEKLTVQELINKLQSCNPEAIVCFYHPVTYPGISLSSLSTVEPLGSQHFYTPEGNDDFIEEGDTVMVF
jgi:hypothetical protein